MTIANKKQENIKAEVCNNNNRESVAHGCSKKKIGGDLRHLKTPSSYYRKIRDTSNHFSITTEKTETVRNMFQSTTKKIQRHLKTPSNNPKKIRDS